jgi:hypothetical protein
MFNKKQEFKHANSGECQSLVDSEIWLVHVLAGLLVLVSRHGGSGSR